ncbi:MAG: hypothetical protein OXB84_04975 [Halobacteriovoraceae bacterium]|nr:hypothetical protein [Halobacteriovoraceae bacterium]
MKTYDKDTCEELSMRKYRGWPQAAYEFEKNCRNIKILYTTEHCQKAFNKLNMGVKLSRLKEEFGPKIDKCFNESDIKNSR